MRGLQQEFRRVPHSLQQDQQSGRWTATLFPELGDPVVCPSGANIAEAVQNAETTAKAKFPGRTL